MNSNETTSKGLTVEETGNRLIFDFMGYVHSQHADINKWEMSKLEYHFSWSSLIPVWVKIKHIGADQGYRFKKVYESFHVGIDKGDISACWKCIVNWLENEKMISDINSIKNKDNG